MLHDDIITSLPTVSSEQYTQAKMRLTKLLFTNQFGGEGTSQSISMASWKTITPMLVTSFAGILVIVSKLDKRPKGEER